MTPSPIARLRKRREYLAMRGAERVAKPAFVLLCRRRRDDETAAAGRRFGYTVTRRTGNAVERNRIRRRLKEAVRQAAANGGEARFDHVLIARRAALTRDFAALVADLRAGLDRASGNASKRRKSGNVAVVNEK